MNPSTQRDDRDYRSRIRQSLERCCEGLPLWPYRMGSDPAVEPTVFASLAVLATAGDDLEIERGRLQTAGDWLAALQQEDGSVGVGPKLPFPQWPTSLAILLWKALRAHPESMQKAIGWLMTLKGVTFRSDPDDPVQHDTTIAGWPWVRDTHSWLEPTAFAVLALRAAGPKENRRVEDGIALIVDRSLPSGGWNYGNREVFGAELRPQVGPTGVALLALAGLETPPPAAVPRAISYLQKELPNLRAPQSLCWGLIGLTAWNRRPADADLMVRQSFEAFFSPGTARPLRTDGPALLAYLLLASSESAPMWFGIASQSAELLK